MKTVDDIKRKEYFDRVYGGWLGKCIGGAAGAPVEGIKKLLPYEDYKALMRPDLPNDDLDLQLLWLEVMEEKGMAVTAADMAEAWEKHCWYPFSEYGYFLKNYERGILPPYSGAFNNNFFSESEGCPIRSEIWGMLFPEDPEKAARYAGLDGSLDHTKNAVWIEQYYAAVESAAFAGGNLKTVLEIQKKYLPEDSRAFQCLSDIQKWVECFPEDWKHTWKLLMRKYLHPDFTNAVINLGICVMALLYGEEDLDKVINIAFQSGYDTDCTCATAGAIWGILHGASAIPAELKNLVGDEFVIGIDIKRTDTSIRQLAEDTCALGERIKNEKRMDSDKIKIEVDYSGVPSIGLDDKCIVKVKLINSSEKIFCDNVKIAGVPNGWKLNPEFQKVEIRPGESWEGAFEFQTTKKVTRIESKNIFRAEAGADSRTFGIAGAAPWQGIGPFFEALDKADPPGMPSPHGEGCNLPTVECMVNNAVFLGREYLDEKHLKEAFSKEDTVWIQGYEDLLALDEVFDFKGQGCVYLRQEVVVETDETVWAIIGNNDGFRLWMNQEMLLEKDEIRVWTPCNNCVLVPLKKGKNEMVLKLLRRTESLKFSIGLRKYEGEHFHRKRWCTDLAYERP